jgi:phosphoglycolate phosphatase
MQTKTILFDLDGTLTDSGEGIINCATLALNHFGLPVPDRETMRVFVGPPLRDTFFKFGVPADKLDEAVAVYRSRYIPIGKFENTPYPGIHETLAALKNAGHTLYVATSKPEEMSKEILQKFELAQYFDLICGATFDGSRDSKESVIAYLLEQAGGVSNAVMVGDTVFDIVGAAAHDMPGIGVSWGYGNVQEMVDAGATAIAHSMEELLSLLL